MRKVTLTLFLIVLAGAGAAWYFVTYRMDSIIESRLEKAASLALGSRVQVGGVHTRLRDGSLTVERITVANPPGFANPHALRFGGIEAAVDYDRREVKRLVIARPEFFIEERGGLTNFGRMLKDIEAAAAGDSGAAPGTEPEIVIRYLRIDGTHAAFESHSYDRVTEVEVEAIELHDLRGTPSELAERIGRAVVGELSAEAATALLRAQARSKFGELEEQVGGKLRELLGGDDAKD